MKPLAGRVAGPEDPPRGPSQAAGGERDLWRRGRSLRLDPSSREELILRHLPLVRVAAGRLAMLLAFPADPDDWHGAGALALIRAVDAFDPSRGVPFRAFAYPRIYGAMVDHVRAQDWVPRGVRDAAHKLRRAYFELAGGNERPPGDEEVAAHLSLSIKRFESLVQRAVPALLFRLDTVEEAASGHPLRDVIPGPDGSPSARLERQEMADLVAGAVAELSEAERAVIVLRYSEGLMFKEVAGIMDRSRARISQLHTRALLRLRGLVSRALEPKTPPAGCPALPDPSGNGPASGHADAGDGD
jgi:RNA polymerase sigma factor for flagellar operon FliA